MKGLIKIIKYKGLHGGFATNESTLYRVDVKGLDGSFKHAGPYSELKDAINEATHWSKFTGFPMIKIEITKVYKEVEIEVNSF